MKLTSKQNKSQQWHITDTQTRDLKAQSETGLIACTKLQRKRIYIAVKVHYTHKTMWRHNNIVVNMDNIK